MLTKNLDLAVMDFHLFECLRQNGYAKSLESDLNGLKTRVKERIANILPLQQTQIACKNFWNRVRE